MGNRYVDVVITRQTKAVSQAGFGLPLILSTEKAAAYKEYSDIAVIGTDYGVSSETYKLAQAIFGQNPAPSLVAVYGIVYDAVTGDPTALTTALNDLVKTHNDFFYLVSVEQADEEITTLSNWNKTQKKLYFASTSNKALPALLTPENTVILVHDHPETYPAEAWVGVGAPLEVGSFTWTFKTLNGILPAAYDTDTINTIEENNASTYIKESGINITSKGVTTSGEYIDVIQGQYYLEARMAENMFAMLASVKKVPFTYGGIAMGVAVVESTLKDGTDKQIIATDKDDKPEYNISTPDLADISASDRASRTLPDIPWVATIAGAIEHVGINGVLKI